MEPFSKVSEAGQVFFAIAGDVMNRLKRRALEQVEMKVESSMASEPHVSYPDNGDGFRIRSLCNVREIAFFLSVEHSMRGFFAREREKVHEEVHETAKDVRYGIMVERVVIVSLDIVVITVYDICDRLSFAASSGTNRPKNSKLPMHHISSPSSFARL